jgi:DNA-binding response OmpR family regulator
MPLMSTDAPAMKVLVVEDDPDLCDAIVDVLSRHGFSVERAGTRQGAMEGSTDVHLVVLDLGLPDGDGLDVCGELSKRVPLIVISARADETDRIVALELGADDYLAKPFGPRELVARVRSVLRRSARGTGVIVRSGDLAVDLDRYEVTLAGESIELTTKERELLVAIARRNGNVVKRGDLADEVWGANLWLVSRTLDVHMSSLRRKLGDTGRNASFVQTVHGIGYRLL